MFFPNHRRRQQPFGNRGVDVFTMFMAMRLYEQIQRLPVKPPLTLAIMALLAILWFAPDESKYQEYYRFFVAPLLHVNSQHLFFNLSSFLYKGSVLETTYGSETFLVVVGIIYVLSQAIFLLLSMFPLFPDAYITSTVGFSGVIFGLKVLLNNLNNLEAFDFNNLLGFHLPWNQVVWVELVMSWMMNPGSSFLGHLAGILAGFALLPFFPYIVTSVRQLAFGFNFPQPDFNFRQNQYQNYAPPQQQPQHRPAPPPPVEQPPAALSMEELRNRRLNRFQ